MIYYIIINYKVILNYKKDNLFHVKQYYFIIAKKGVVKCLEEI